MAVNDKICTDAALFSVLNIQQFSFESLKGNKKETNQEIFKVAALSMPSIDIKTGTYYRARKILDEDGEEKRKPVNGNYIQSYGVRCVTVCCIDRANAGA